MLKDATYQEKCFMLKSWMPQILESIKKDLKNEHLKKDFKFMKKYFSGKNVNRLTHQDMVHAYTLAIEQDENAEQIAEFLTNHWLLKNSDLYNYFETALSKISPEFTEMTEIGNDQSKEILEGSIHHFGAPRTYIFSVMNSVVFPKEIYESLDQLAQESQKKIEQEEEASNLQIKQESLVQHYEELMARQKDKYEKKLLGMEKKYFTDIEALRKQIVALQKRLNG